MPASQMTAHPELVAHNGQFEKSIIELAPGVYTALGFAASNMHMLVGDDGIVIIDTTESTSAAENVLTEFRKITDKPVKTIIYTHSHRDHISGASVFAADDVEIIASHLFASDLIGLDENRPAPDAALMERTKRQFGIGLSFPDERVNLGCGPGDRPMKGLGQGFVPPNNPISEERITLEREGIAFELIHAPGETPDHLVVWLADKRILFCGDNYYHSFPNLYAIRGTPYRDFDTWADTLDLLLGFEAQALSPGHTHPVLGASNVKDVLTDYRDAMRHVVRASADAMNEGLGWDDVAAKVQLPDHLAHKPHLQEFYGKVSWSVRAYCAGTLGWFDGNPTNLNRLSPDEESKRWVDLAGGFEKLFNVAQNAAANDDHQWALELIDRLVSIKPNDKKLALLKANSLRELAKTEINATARNTYLLFAQQLENVG